MKNPTLVLSLAIKNKLAKTEAAMKTSFSLVHGFLSIAVIAMLSACGPSSDPAAPKAANSKSRMPSDPAIKSLYIQSCYGCHSSGAGNAPRTGEVAEWQSRWEQGLPMLLKHTKEGFKNMPPKGMCMSCSDTDLSALIRFMAGKENEQTPQP
jgi:cytochrome c5